MPPVPTGSGRDARCDSRAPRRPDHEPGPVMGLFLCRRPGSRKMSTEFDQGQAGQASPCHRDRHRSRWRTQGVVDHRVRGRAARAADGRDARSVRCGRPMAGAGCPSSCPETSSGVIEPRRGGPDGWKASARSPSTAAGRSCAAAGSRCSLPSTTRSRTFLAVVATVERRSRRPPGLHNAVGIRTTRRVHPPRVPSTCSSRPPSSLPAGRP